VSDRPEICLFSGGTSSFVVLVVGMACSAFEVDLLALTDGEAVFFAPNKSLNMSLPFGMALREG